MEGDVSLQLPQGSPAPAGSTRAPQTTAHSEFADAVLSGFARSQRSIPCRFFYDAVGSELFEEIVKLDEYYPTRVETALLEAHCAKIAGAASDARVLIEFGSGSSRKTSLLLGALTQVSTYVPIDIAAESLRRLPRGCQSGMTGSPSFR